MKIRLIKQSDNSILATGRGEDSIGNSAWFRDCIPVDCDFMGIPFSELKTLLWVETDAAGNLIGKGVRP
jgi:hypothetical protein